MKKTFLLAGANIRKSKGQMIILAVLFLIAAILMNIGMSLLFNFGSYFERMAEDLNTSDAIIIISQNFWTDEVEQLINESTTEIEKHPAVFLFGEIPWGDNTILSTIAFSDMNRAYNLSRWKLVSDSLPMTTNGAYVPFGWNIHGHELGNNFTIDTDGGLFTFNIAGHTESILTDGVNSPANILIPTERFNELYDSLYENRAYIVFANGVTNFQELLFNISELSGFPTGFDSVIGGIALEAMIVFRTMMANMTAMILVLFTIVIVAVSMFVVRFRIKNGIEEDMVKIGSLQSIGYTSKQIKRSIIAQYSLIVLLSTILSIIPAIFILPMIGEVLAAQSGIFWRPGATPGIYIITLIFLVLVVWLATKLSARGIRKITPVLAMRGGLETHNFKRNRIPLSKSRLPLTSALAAKTILQNKRQSFMMFFIMLAVSFTAVVALVLFYNSTINLSSFELIPGNERANSAIALRPD